MDWKEEIIAEERQSDQQRELRRVYHLAQRAYWVTVLLGLLIPITAYLYTRRWRAMCIFLALIGFMGVVFAPEEESDEWEPSPMLMVLAAVGSTVDNTQAIRWAKQKMAGSGDEI